MFMEKEIERCYRLARNNSQMQFLHSLKEIEEEHEDEIVIKRMLEEDKEWENDQDEVLPRKESFNSGKGKGSGNNCRKIKVKQ